MDFPPLPVQQHYWEEICTYLLAHIVQRRFHIKCKFDMVGKRGDKQWGIDLITSSPEANGIVGQCKHKEPGKRLEIKEIFDTLDKTDNYLNNIEHLIFLTNSDVHPIVQTKFMNPVYHTRPDSSKFQVHIEYWRNFPNLRIIPIEKLKQFFPEQLHYAKYFFPPKDVDLLVDAADHAYSALPKRLSKPDIDAIQDSSYNNKLSDFIDEKIVGFIQDIDRARLLKFGLREYLYNPKVRDMYRMLPAIESLGIALIEFRKMRGDIPDPIGKSTSEIRMLFQLQKCANDVVRIYNAIVTGESPS